MRPVRSGRWRFRPGSWLSLRGHGVGCRVGVPREEPQDREDRGLSGWEKRAFGGGEPQDPLRLLPPAGRQESRASHHETGALG